MKRFWNWVRDETNPQERTLRLEGAIAEESWFDDEISPKIFRQELFDGDGPITVWINSPGGDCVAAAQIYNMLMDYPHDITVKVDGIAASAASVIAMAGTRVIMTPVSLMMIHNPLTVAMGDSDEMKRGTTPTNTFKTNIDLTGATVFLTYSQRGRVVLEKTGDDLEISAEAVVTRLTQKDTLGFDALQKVSIQIRYVFPDGTAGASNIMTASVGEILKDGEISP